MADKKISALTTSTTPLAGTEVLPIVQSGATVKVSIDNLTAGRTPQVAGVLVGNGASTSAAVLNYKTNTTDYYVGIDGPAGSNTGIPNVYYVLGVGNYPISFWTNLNERVRIEGGGDVNVKTGNLVIGTSGKGIDFSATAGTGTSELLADYEEGTFTPTVFGGTDAGTATYSTQVGLYTKVGRQVTVTAYINWSGGTGTGSMNFGGLPYTTNSNNYGAGAIWAEIGLAASNTLVLRILGSSTSLQPLNTPVGGGVSNTVTYTASGAVMVTATYFV